jgi:transcriptional regulator with XRE-family HTH domain
MSAKPKPPSGYPNPENLREVLAFQIRSRRVVKGWSQEKLAFEAELDRTYVSAVERCTWNVSLSNIEKIAKALDSKAYQLLMPPLVHEFEVSNS